MSLECFVLTDKAQTSLKQLDAVVLIQASNDLKNTVFVNFICNKKH